MTIKPVVPAKGAGWLCTFLIFETEAGKNGCDETATHRFQFQGQSNKCAKLGQDRHGLFNTTEQFVAEFARIRGFLKPLRYRILANSAQSPCYRPGYDGVQFLRMK